MDINNQPKSYSVYEINGMMNALRNQYDIVRLVDVDECRILTVEENGDLQYGKNCFSIWGRNNRCANCTSFRACQTHQEMDKYEHLGHDREAIHSIPLYLEMSNGETGLCVVECVNYSGTEGNDFNLETPAECINTHDILTGLFTREKIMREIRQVLIDNPDEDYLIIVTNIRNFNLVNRLFGEDNGNRLLMGMADSLRENYSDKGLYARDRDDRFILFIRKDRFDGEKFISQLEEVAKLLISPVFSIQIKFGICEIKSRNLSVSKMIDHASLAVNSIRDKRNVTMAYFTDDMMENSLKNRQILADFEDALKNEEFKIYIQPQVLADGTIRGGEVLVRWIKPDGTIFMPGEFLPVLQKSELLSFLDRYVWEKAAQVLCRWKGTPLERLYLSINVDPTDFYYLDVVQVLKNLCEKYAIDPVKLRVEITETALVEDVERQNRIVDSLHESGFLVEIDDFGKGFSSLGMLKDIQADVLKIDMSFIRQENYTQRSAIILDSVIDMAENLKMDVVTEGVETLEQVKNLITLGCRNFQGFYFSRPIPVRDFELVVEG